MPPNRRATVARAKANRLTGALPTDKRNHRTKKAPAPQRSIGRRRERASPSPQVQDEILQLIASGDLRLSGSEPRSTPASGVGADRASTDRAALVTCADPLCRTRFAFSAKTTTIRLSLSRSTPRRPHSRPVPRLVVSPPRENTSSTTTPTLTVQKSSPAFWLPRMSTPPANREMFLRPCG